MELDKIYNEDCLEGMKNIPDGSIDCIICDLPYGVLNKSNKTSQWDNKIPLEPLWNQYWRIAKRNAAVVLFSQGMFTAELMMSQPKFWRYNLIWDKQTASGFLNANKMPMRGHEDIVVFYRSLPTFNPQMKKCAPDQRTHSKGTLKGKLSFNCYGKSENYPTRVLDEKYPSSIISIPREHNVKSIFNFHPTQKPVDLIRYLVRTYSNEEDLVLDNCMGSGTTAIACIREKRHFSGFETDKGYFDQSCARIEAEKKNQTQMLF